MPELLHNISLEAYKGETIALIGENGCGKTTLGKILSGLIRCRHGAFYIDGKKVKQQKLSDYVYFVMQEADHQLYTCLLYTSGAPSLRTLWRVKSARPK